MMCIIASVFELFSGEFENDGERCCLWNVKREREREFDFNKHFKGKLWIEGQSHFEGRLRMRLRW